MKGFSKCWHCNATDRRCWARLYTMNWETQRFIVDWPRLPIIKKWNVTVSNDAMLIVGISTTFGWEITGTSSFSRSFSIQSRYWIITTWISVLFIASQYKDLFILQSILKSMWAAWFQREKTTFFHLISLEMCTGSHHITSYNPAHFKRRLSSK